MLEVIVFAVALVVSNVVATLILMKVFMSKRFLKKYIEVINDMAVSGFVDKEWD